MTHGSGPDSILDIVLVVVAVSVVLLAFYLAIRYTIRPGEESPDHIKRQILDEGGKERR